MSAAQVLRSFGDTRVSALDGCPVRLWLMGLVDREFSGRANLVLLVIRMIAKGAREAGCLRKGPFLGVTFLEPPETRVHPIAPDELDPVPAALPAWWRPYLTVAFWTGVRRIELAAIE